MAPLPAELEQLARKILSLAPLTPTRSTQEDASRVLARQETPGATITIVSQSHYVETETLSGGAIAGIVVGSVVGFLLLLWILYSCTNLGAPPSHREAWYEDVKADRHHHHHHSPHGHHSHHRYHHRSDRSLRPVAVTDRSSRSPRRPSPVY